MIGAAITTICWFTPVLVVLLGMQGLARLAGVLDHLLLPILLGLIVYALIRKSAAVAERVGSR
jgi:mercuric ion transport protein